MSRPRTSLRSQLMIGSVLWTLGLLIVVSVGLIVFLAHHPQPHRMVLGWMMATPAIVTVAIGAGCMSLGVWRIRASLAAVDRIRAELAGLQRGERSQVSGRYPAEVQPLVDGVNALLEEREQRINRAMAKAADLAHGLKTPLAVLSRDACRAAHLDDTLAESLDAQIQRMRRQIDYHLAHARATAASSTAGVRTPVAPVVAALFRTLDRLYAERQLVFEQAIPDAHAVDCRREDLDEILGNVLDNACKWARSRVRVESLADHGGITVSVDDDGAGLEASQAQTVLGRGVRADESVPGSGFGLAIARDLVELYRGSIELSASSLGGLRVQIRLPGEEITAGV